MEGRNSFDCTVSFAPITTTDIYQKNKLHATLWLAPSFFITQWVLQAPGWAMETLQPYPSDEANITYHAVPDSSCSVASQSLLGQC